MSSAYPARRAELMRALSRRAFSRFARSLCVRISGLTCAGSMISSYFLSTRPHAPIPLFVNVSGRYNMARILENRKYDADFAKQGYQDWEVKIAGKQASRRVTPAGVRSFLVAKGGRELTRSTGPQLCRVGQFLSYQQLPAGDGGTVDAWRWRSGAKIHSLYLAMLTLFSQIVPVEGPLSLSFPLFPC